MATIDPAKVWSLNYRLLMSVITAVAPNIAALGLETKELFLLGEVEAHPYPAELRRHRLVVTHTGRKAVSRGLALLSDGFGARLERLSAAERTALQRLL